MTCKTHIACSTATSLVIIKPTTPKLLVLTLVGSVVGSILPDIDTYNSESKQILKKIILTTTLTIILATLIEYKFNLGLYKYLVKSSNFNNLTLTSILFLVISIIGSNTNHRSFMHSILALIIFLCILSLSLPIIIVKAFTIAMLSHILLDLLNHIGVTIFFPFKKRLCLDLCDSNGLINNLLFLFGTFFIIIELIIYLSK